MWELIDGCNDPLQLEPDQGAIAADLLTDVPPEMSGDAMRDMQQFVKELYKLAPPEQRNNAVGASTIKWLRTMQAFEAKLRLADANVGRRRYEENKLHVDPRPSTPSCVALSSETLTSSCPFWSSLSAFRSILPPPPTSLPSCAKKKTVSPISRRYHDTCSRCTRHGF